MTPFQSISKLEAATRQLHAAILLYFQEADPLAVLTVAGAAHGILVDLSKSDGRAIGMIQPGSHVLVARMLAEARSFLKHADRDPAALLQFNPEWTDFILYDAIGMHLPLAKLRVPDLFFLFWITGKYPTVLLLDDLLGPKLAEYRKVFPQLGDRRKRIFHDSLTKWLKAQPSAKSSLQGPVPAPAPTVDP